MQTGHALVAVICVIGALAFLAAAVATNGRRVETPTGPAPTAFRYCPDEQRTRAALLHPDGTAHCGGCGCLLDPAGD
ncbi:hypothetical protein [Actinacidiphila reveromycinica]|nr:hypothetical protein [Streptomyces sp. SN-593]